MARARKQEPTQWQKYVAMFLNDECCGQPMQSGFDCMWVTELDFEGEANAYYRSCDVCGNIEVRRPEALRSEFEWEASRGTRY